MTQVMNKLMSQQQRTMNNRPENQYYRQGGYSSNRPAVQEQSGYGSNNRPTIHQQRNGSSNRPPVQGQRDTNRQARRCYNCNLDKHLIKNCPKPKGHDKDKEKGRVCLSSTNHAGLFVQAEFGEYSAGCLVDTGATLNLISSKVWSTIKGSENPEEFNKNIVSASGNVLDTKGKTKVCFEINGVSCVMDMVIAEMDIDARLWLDFILKHNVVVDVVGMVMHIKGKSCPLIKVGRIGCYRVIVTERVPVPSRSEIILEGQLVAWDSNDDGIGIIILGRIP